MVKRSWGEVLAGLSPKGSVNKPAGIRSLVYGKVKGKVGIEGLSVSRKHLALGRSTCGDAKRLQTLLVLLQYCHFNRFDTSVGASAPMTSYRDCRERNKSNISGDKHLSRQVTKM